MTKILAFAGSKRNGSLNKRFVDLAASYAEQAGAELTLVDMADYTMPLYDADLESQEGIEVSVMAFKELMKTHHGFLVACPEYNGSITPLLKNTIDWASRKAEGEKPAECFKGKAVALISASPGALGGLRGLNHVRDIFSNLGSLVIAEKLALPGAHNAFDEQGQLRDAAMQQRLKELCEQLLRVSNALSS